MSGPAPTVAKGYRVVPQRLWPAPVESPSSVPGVRPGAGYRYLHIKEHRGIFRVTSGKNHGEAVKAREFAKGTTLFVGNVDDQGGRLCRKEIADRLRRAFSNCGHVSHVQISPPEGTDNHKTINGRGQAQVGKKAMLGSRFAHVSFSTADGVQAALALQGISSGTDLQKKCKKSRKRTREGAEDEESLPSAKDSEPSLDENGDETLGYAGLIQRHRRNFLPRSELQAEVDTIMERFEDEEAEEAAKRKALLENPTDDDGFITVTYKKKRGRSVPLPVAADLAAANAAAGVKKKRKGAGSLPDFYRFQMRESRREQLVNLRAKFEQDKARVAKMKENRKFRPF